jgi:sugar fermentation stimulation protein A
MGDPVEAHLPDPGRLKELLVPGGGSSSGGGSGARRRAPGAGAPLEVKSVTLVEDGIALFPDAVTARGARHVRELTERQREGHPAAILFVAQREDVREIRAAASIDPAFAGALQEAVEAGVRVLGRRCRVDLDGVRLLDPVPAGPG